MVLIGAGCGAGFIWPQIVQRMRLSVPVYRSALQQCAGIAGTA
ncbi:hypothetical protein NT01EI_1883 [Edwardsiella ictaluri 93-146]|uniref:Uncharacterized protein n=1 Tax=Edwardsiella ictaluri (strain 93-146) TaxID=634503 RepID=C5B843_EDWI9|nr:hypothetical protein NT01EI_1883 [Edwardsiella ictaluri 93-146]